MIPGAGGLYNYAAMSRSMGQNKLIFVGRIPIAIQGQSFVSICIGIAMIRNRCESSRSGTCSVGLLRGSKREEGRESSDAVEESDAQLALHSCIRAGEQTD